MSQNTNAYVKILVSADGVETISVPYQSGNPAWLDVLTKSAWAFDLLHGAIRHHNRSLQHVQNASTLNAAKR